MREPWRRYSLNDSATTWRCIAPGHSERVRAQEYVEAAAARMRADGSEVSHVQLPLGPAVVGYRSEFRLRWVATKLHLFTVVAPAAAATTDVVDRLGEQAIDYAKQAKGRLRGLQTGVAALPVIVSSEVDAAAIAAVESAPTKRFAAFVVPTIVDLSSGVVHRYRGRLVWGAIYSAWLHERLDALPSPDSPSA